MFIGRGLEQAIVGEADDRAGLVKVVGQAQPGTDVPALEHELVMLIAQARGKRQPLVSVGILNRKANLPSTPFITEEERNATTGEVVRGQVGIELSVEEKVEVGIGDTEGEDFAHWEAKRSYTHLEAVPAADVTQGYLCASVVRWRAWEAMSGVLQGLSRSCARLVR